MHIQYNYILRIDSTYTLTIYTVRLRSIWTGGGGSFLGWSKFFVTGLAATRYLDLQVRSYVFWKRDDLSTEKSLSSLIHNVRNVHVHACTCYCIYVYTCTCTCMYMHTLKIQTNRLHKSSPYDSVHLHVHVYIYANMHIRIIIILVHVYTHMYVYTYTCT